MLCWRGLLLSRNVSSWLVLDWARTRKVIGTGYNLSPINNKDGLTITTTLQSGLSREADVLKHKSLGNKRGVYSARGRLLRWTLSSKWNKDVIISFVLDLRFLVKNSGVDGLKNWNCSEIKCKRTP